MDSRSNLNERVAGDQQQERWRARFALMILVVAALAVATQFGAAQAAAGTAVVGDGVAFLPATLSGYYQGIEVNPGGISGNVTVDGKPTADIPLDLYFNDGNDWSIADSTQTDSKGYYSFVNIKSLLLGEKYFVSFGPNESNPDLVYNWYGPLIEDYQEGDRILGGDFDLADVRLVSPESGFVGQLPIMFEWERRNLNGETYRVVVIDFGEDIFWPTFDLGDVDSFVLNLLAPDMLYNRQYSWYLEVYMGPDNYGESYMLNDIKFLPPSATTREAAGRVLEHPFQPDPRRGRR